MLRYHANGPDDVAQNSISWADLDSPGLRAQEERDEHRGIAGNPSTFLYSDRISLCRSIVHGDTVEPWV